MSALEELSIEELTALRRKLTPRWPLTGSQYVPHVPTPTQQAFLLLSDREVLYGGAAGGGKTDALLMAALQYVDVPGYAALLLRRTWQDLSQEEAIMDRANKWLDGTDAVKRKGGRLWIFPSGATLRFGHAQNYKEATQQFSGPEFQYIGIDELTQGWERRTWEFLRTRLRRPAKGRRHTLSAAPDGMTLADVPLRERGGTNPGGSGHIWVKGRFITGEGTRDGKPLPFVPAKLTDNPHVDQTSYMESLDVEDPVLRARLLDGDWDITEGRSMFTRTWFRYLDEVPTDDSIEWVRYWDMAGTEPKDGSDPDWTVGALVGLVGGQWVVAHLNRFQGEPHDVEAEMRATCVADAARFKRYTIVIEQEPGSAGKTVVSHFKRNVLPGLPVQGDRPSGSKDLRARTWQPAARSGDVLLVRAGWNEAFLQEVELFPHDCPHDDQVDAISGAVAFHPQNPATQGKKRSRVVL